MTSETADKRPLILLPFGNAVDRDAWHTYTGVFVVIATWVYLYWACLSTLYDGVTEFLFSGPGAYVVSNVVSEVAHRALSNQLGSGGAPAGSVEFGSGKYYALCGLGGVLSCGITHTAIVPLDMVKCRIQELSYTWRTSVYLAASASAEFFADMLLAPMEATKVRIQTAPGAPPTLRGCLPYIYKTEGLTGFYKGLPPLWMRQIPYTMMKFACFERTVELLYKHVVPKPREHCSKSEQLVVTFVAGYIAGVFCAIVSHPADTVVSKLNQDAGASAGDILRKLGPMGVWGGLLPRIIMIGTLTALQWFIYDAVKVAFNLPRPPPPSMPDSLKQKLAAAGSH